jgi:hypothetical protein
MKEARPALACRRKRIIVKVKQFLEHCWWVKLWNCRWVFEHHFLQMKELLDSIISETDTMSNCNESAFSLDWNILSRQWGEIIKTTIACLPHIVHNVLKINILSFYRFLLTMLQWYDQSMFLEIGCGIYRDG